MDSKYLKEATFRYPYRPEILKRDSLRLSDVRKILQTHYDTIKGLSIENTHIEKDAYESVLLDFDFGISQKDYNEISEDFAMCLAAVSSLILFALMTIYPSIILMLLAFIFLLICYSKILTGKQKRNLIVKIHVLVIHALLQQKAITRQPLAYTCDKLLNFKY